MSWLLILFVVALAIVLISGTSYGYSHYSTGSGGTVVQESGGPGGALAAMALVGVLLLALILVGFSMGWFSSSTNTQPVPFTGPTSGASAPALGTAASQPSVVSSGMPSASSS